MLGNIIKELRKKKRMTQRDLAKAMKVSQQTVGAWETGRAIPGADTLSELADYFNVTTDYLLGKPDKKEKKSVELSDDDVIMTYQGKELSNEDKEIIRRLMNGK